ncbi:hypothetical protein [Ktedonospora formicarum]|uniref:Uncharacterized protein n=1 Tax=Ktedonospora formicarum TaxID=2778364 RepID=A0A8J3IFQ5_9CHLR|nr:hypothetical protein [Ktedonospora formicarum]GHO51498.1 hypothetical protein KSX_96610 [Ktedonospora formicarum]GHO51523.1 hypothetical protein KSX_96860 [Ktedonospora formicarum]
MRRIITQVEIIEEDDGSLRLIFLGKHEGKHKTMLPFATQTARKVNKDLYFTLQAILSEDHPGTIEGYIEKP